MKKIVAFAVMAIAIALLLSGCSAKEITSENSVIGADYLKDKGYEIIAYEGNVENYILTKEKLMSMPYMIYWGLQREEPSRYLSKEVHVEKFIIKNHPFDNWQSTSRYPENIVESKGETRVWVYIADKEVVGGISYPAIDEPMAGGYWSLDGKTLEEVHSINYSDWLEQWQNKFDY
ncbi:hypothetical protein [Desulfitobacterium hafniense]|uniref:hypothetical protein n=1 Tax=Desulfitobacterium hafniense TaxID=49338 RepID=UPI000364AF7C|nr:hypothetical protein [Desulfitobacterium hafniense]